MPNYSSSSGAKPHKKRCWLSKSCPLRTAATHLLQDIVKSGDIEKLARKDPRLAAARLSSQPLDMRTMWIARDTATVWANQDARAALEWVETLPESVVRDRSLEAIAFGVVGRDPDLAVRIAESIDDKKARAFILFNATAQQHKDADILRSTVKNWMSPSPSKRI
jgi:hypothetical protein